MSPPGGYDWRPATWEDLEAVVRLFKACDRADAGVEDPTREHLEEQWRRPSFDLGHDSTVALDEGGSIVAYGEVSGLNPELSFDAHGRVDPAHRARGLGAALVAWALERAADRTPTPPKLYSAISDSDLAGRDLLERNGFAYARTFRHMERDLRGDVARPAPPPGIELRPYRHPDDSGGAYDALDEAFRDHWGYEPFPRQVHDDEMGRADPAITPVAADGGEIVGVCLARLVEGTGWVDVVGVRPAWRGRGIARSLLGSTFAGLAELGVPGVLLNVDSENATGALGLYASVGMHVRRAWHVFEKPLVADIS